MLTCKLSANQTDTITTNLYGEVSGCDPSHTHLNLILHGIPQHHELVNYHGISRHIKIWKYVETILVVENVM